MIASAVAPNVASAGPAGWLARSDSLGRERIVAALRACAASVLADGPGQWRLTLRDAPPWPVHTGLTEDWLTLAVAIPALAEAEPWALLCANATLPPWLKYALDEHAVPWLRAELRPLPGAPIEAQAQEVTTHLANLMNAPRHPPTRRRSGATNACAAAAGHAAPLELDGWPARTRADGGQEVLLDVPGAAWHARLAASPGGVRATVQWAAWPALAKPCRAALARFLLAASGAVGLVCAYAANLPTGIAVGGQVLCPPGSPGPVLAAGLAALSVLTRLCAEEAQALAEPGLAEAFLQMWGTVPP